MRVKERPLIVVAFVLTLGFMRLGGWQLARLHQRQRINAELASRAENAPVPISQLPTDTATAHYRRVSVNGTYDYTNEIVLTLRSREGSPGVNLVTPLKSLSNDTALLIVRGWVYSPDGMTLDLNKWREDPQVSGSGFVETYPPHRSGPNNSPTHPNAFRWLDRAALEKRFNYPLKAYYVVLTAPVGDTTKNTPPRLTVPPMDEGPHRSYAAQWFSFAAISIIGTILFLRRK
ncbi:MAG: SURF1 family protein [Gemmatimonadaceae bacterium]